MPDITEWWSIDHNHLQFWPASNGEIEDSKDWENKPDLSEIEDWENSLDSDDADEG